MQAYTLLAAWPLTLKMCVKAGLDSQRAIEDVVSICCKISTHLGHSTLPKERMSAIQSTIPGLQAHAIIQDMQTRWNSTYYMVQHMLDQKKAVVSYASEHDLPATRTKHQWGLLDFWTTGPCHHQKRADEMELNVLHGAAYAGTEEVCQIRIGARPTGNADKASVGPTREDGRLTGSI